MTWLWILRHITVHICTYVWIPKFISNSLLLDPGIIFGCRSVDPFDKCQKNLHVYVKGPFNMKNQGGGFKNAYELLNLRALKFSPVNKIHIFQCRFPTDKPRKISMIFQWYFKTKFPNFHDNSDRYKNKMEKHRTMCCTWSRHTSCDHWHYWVFLRKYVKSTYWWIIYQ